MKKLFISQPMRDKTDDQIKAEREKAIETAKRTLGEDVEAIDSFFENAPHDAKPIWFLGKSLELLADADVAYFCAGWDKYRGCVIEHEVCLRKGIPCMHTPAAEVAACDGSWPADSGALQPAE